MTRSSAHSGRTMPGIGSTWLIRLPSTTINPFGLGARPDPSIKVPFLIKSRCVSCCIGVLQARLDRKAKVSLPFREAVRSALSAHELADHDVRTAPEMAWTTIKNGELLTLASSIFDVFVTVDRNLSFQENIASFAVSVVVLQARTNRLADLQPLVPNLLSAIECTLPGTVKFVGRR